MRIQGLNNQYQYRYNKLNNNTDTVQKPVGTIDNTQNNISFQGKGGLGDKLGEFIGKLYGEQYAQRMMNSKWIHTLSKKLAGSSGMMTQHMAALGAFLTSSVYFTRTVKNKDMDPDKRTVLGINQIGCFILPTAGAYLADNLLKNFNKGQEYLYSGLKRQQMATGQLSAAECEKLTKTLGTKLKSFGALMGLATFTLIYRYAAPVIVTPIANKIGDAYLAKKKEKKAEQEAMVNNQQNLETAKA